MCGEGGLLSLLCLGIVAIVFIGAIVEIVTIGGG